MEVGFIALLSGVFFNCSFDNRVPDHVPTVGPCVEEKKEVDGRIRTFT